MPRDDVDRLIRLVRGGESCVTIVTHEEGEALEVVRQAAMGLGRGVWLWSSAGGVRDGLVEGGRGVGAGVSVGRAGGVGGGGGGGGGGDEMALRAAAGLLLLGEASRCHEGTVCVALDAGDHIDDPMALRSLRETVMGASRLGGCVVLIDHRDRYPESVAAHSTRFEIALPNEEELERVVRSTLRSMHRDREVVIDLKRSEYSAILRNLLGLTRRQAARVVAEAVADDRRLSIEDLTTIMAHKRRAVEAAGLLEFVESPMSLDEIGGLEKLKNWLRDRESTMGLGVGFSGRGLSDSGDVAGSAGGGGGSVGGVGGVLAARYRLSAPRGVLLLGVQGAGKSLCAKAIATAWRRPLLRLDVGSLYDKFIGESEKRLRGALGQAEAMSPVVLWIDEIEKAFAGAASQSSDGGLSRRMFGALLTWMQEHSSPVFLVATANDIEALPAELLRKGRFDEIFFVDLPGEGARRRIFEIHLGRRGLDPGLFELDALVRASEGYSGAEIEQGVLAALHRGVSSAVREGRVGRVGGGGKGEVISTEDVVECLRSSPPLSVTMAEAVGALRAWARDRTVPAD